MLQRTPTVLEKVKGRENACHCRLNHTKNTFSAPVCREVEVGGSRSAVLTCLMLKKKTKKQPVPNFIGDSTNKSFPETSAGKSIQNKEKQSNCFKIQRQWKPLRVKGGDQPLDLVRAPKLANICHQFTRKGLTWTPVNQGCSLWRRSGAAGLPSLTRAAAWAAGRSPTWKTTWLHKACNLKRLWPLIMFWSTSFGPVSGPLLIWDFFCLRVLTQKPFWIWEVDKETAATR